MYILTNRGRNFKTVLNVVPGELITHSLKQILFCLFLVGNLGRVDQVTEFEYDLFIRPDTCNPRFRVWFNFTVENVKESQVNDNQLDGVIASKIELLQNMFSLTK